MDLPLLLAVPPLPRGVHSMVILFGDLKPPRPHRRHQHLVRLRWRYPSSDVFAHFDRQLAYMERERPAYVHVSLVGMLHDEIPDLIDRMSRAKELGYTLQRTPVEQQGDVGTVIVFARKD